MRRDQKGITLFFSAYCFSVASQREAAIDRENEIDNDRKRERARKRLISKTHIKGEKINNLLIKYARKK